MNSAAQGRNWARRLVNVLVAIVVIAVAGATFVFSYDGVHSIALLGGVSDQLARYYPGLFDAVLVIACVAAVMLRDGSWWARLWAWLVIVIVLGAIGATDVLHAMNYTLRHRATEGVVAAAPVVAVLLAFSLLLTLLRKSRTPAPAAPPTVPLDLPALPATVSMVSAPIALPAAPTVAMAPPLAVADAPVKSQDVLAEPTATVPVPMAAVTVADEPAPATVEVPAVVLSREPARPQNIRYAGDDVRDIPPSEDYWDSEGTLEFAGLVFSAPDNDDDETAADEPARRGAPELEDDAPPFAAGPFAPVPRLNRVRSTPTPPTDEDE